MFQLRRLTVDLSVDSIADAKSQFLQATGRRCSTFDVAVARLWQARTRSLRLADPSTRVSVCFFANARHLLRGGAAGFYGNCFFAVTSSAESGAVEAADVAGVVAMIRDAKARLPAEFARWAAGERVEPDPYDLSFSYESLFVSDWTRLGLDADYGWGTPSQVISFAFLPFMAKAIIGAPPAPKAGVRIMTQCVEEVNLPEFRDEMEAAF